MPKEKKFQRFSSFNTPLNRNSSFGSCLYAARDYLSNYFSIENLAC